MAKLSTKFKAGDEILVQNAGGFKATVCLPVRYPLSYYESCADTHGVNEFVICKEVDSGYEICCDANVCTLVQKPQLNTYILDTHTEYDLSTDHTHTWKKYIGLTDQFEYCTECDEKRR